MPYDGKGCPSDEDLGRLVRDVMGEQERQSTALHLMVCEVCERKIKTLRRLTSQRTITYGTNRGM
ncbi:MAG: hypothetical protein WDN47_01285 [Candidatus Doudnabacteria bacterium]